MVTVGGGNQSPPPDRTTGPPTSRTSPSRSRDAVAQPAQPVLAEVLIGVEVLAVMTVLMGSRPAATESAAASTVTGQSNAT